MIIHQAMFNSRGGGRAYPGSKTKGGGKSPFIAKFHSHGLKSAACSCKDGLYIRFASIYPADRIGCKSYFTPCSSHDGQKVTRWGKKDIGSHTMISGTRNVSQEVPSLVLICSPRGTARSGPVDIPHVASWFSNIHLINSFVASSKFIVKHSNRRKTTKNRR